MRSVVVQPDGLIEIKELDGYEGIKAALDNGYLEAVGVGENFVLYVDEDGMGLLRNEVATVVVHKMLARLGRSLIPGDYIKGVAVFVGTENYEEVDLPQMVIDEYFKIGDINEY